MKTIRIGDRNYAIVIFKPKEALRSTAPGKGELVQVLRVAVFEDAGTLAGNGFAFCSPKDDFEPLKGVGIALGRALRQVKVATPATAALISKSLGVPKSAVAPSATHRGLTAEEKHQFYVLAGVAPK